MISKMNQLFSLLMEHFQGMGGSLPGVTCPTPYTSPYQGAAFIHNPITHNSQDVFNLQQLWLPNVSLPSWAIMSY